MTKEAINSPDLVRVSRSCYAVFRHFDVGDSAKREKQLDQIYRGIFGSLAHDVADRRSHGRVEQDASGLHSGKIHAYCLTRLKGSHGSPRIKLCACRPLIANWQGSSAGLFCGAGILPVIFQTSHGAKTPAGRRRH